ncbi:MAG: ABC transporter permease subunit [Chloroflexi bacterium]|jgi:multiple sugar transport system permease protein|nr:ABC transporter permease subunit [Chloroflexota bacterium]
MQDSAPAPSSQTTTDPPKKPLLKKLGFGVWRADQQSEGYLFLLPSLIGFILFVIFPIIASLLLSFYKWDLLTPAEFIGADNYVELATTDPLMGQVLVNTFFYMLTIAPIQLALGFVLALMLNSGLRGMGVYRMIYFMPVVTSIVAAAMVFQFLLNRDSGVLTAYMWWGVEKLFEYDFVLNNEQVAEFVRTYLTPPDWLNDPNWAKPGVIMLTLWKNVGFTMVIYLAALQGIPQTLYEAAEVDGASIWQRVRHITIPLVSPTTFFLLVIQMLGAFQIFEEPFVMTANTQGQVPPASMSIVIYIFLNAFRFQRMGKAAAIAWVLFAIVFALTLIQLRLQRRWVHYETE